MQFVAMKPSNLFHTAQEQIKKAEEIKKVQKESTIKKEEPEDWQNVSALLKIRVTREMSFYSQMVSRVNVLQLNFFLARAS